MSGCYRKKHLLTKLYYRYNIYTFCICVFNKYLYISKTCCTINRSTDRILHIAGQTEISDALNDYVEPDMEVDDEDQLRNQNCHDFDYDENAGEDNDEKAIAAMPKDLDGWSWALSDTESETEEGNDQTINKDDAGDTAAKEVKNAETGKNAHRTRAAELRPEYIECKESGLLFRPEGSTLGVHPAANMWRGSYKGSTHHGRSWGPNRTPKKALLEILKIILEEHVDENKNDKIAKGQLMRVTKAWNEA